MDSLELITDNPNIYSTSYRATNDSLDDYISYQYKDGKYTPPPVQDIKIIIIQLYIICLKLSESYPDNENYRPDLIKITYNQDDDSDVSEKEKEERLKLKVFTGDLDAIEITGYSNTGSRSTKITNPCLIDNRNSFFHAFAAMAYKLITGNNDHEDNAKEVDLFKDGQFVVYVSKDYWEYISNNWSKVQNENYTSIKNLIAAIATPEEHLCRKSLDSIKFNTFKPLLELIQEVLQASSPSVESNASSATDANTQTVKGGRQSTQKLLSQKAHTQTGWQKLKQKRRELH